MYLTEKQKRVYDFLKSYLEEKGLPPSYEEIRRGLGFRSLNSVAKHLKQLEKRGFLRSPWSNRKRAFELLPLAPKAQVIPLLGRVAAGMPIEPFETPDELDVPEWLVRGQGNFALKVTGFSMVEDGIRDGDYLIVRKQDHLVSSGQTVVALLDGEATVKRLFMKEGLVELRPASEKHSPVFAEPDRVEIVGVVVGLYRQYGGR